MKWLLLGLAVGFVLLLGGCTNVPDVKANMPEGTLATYTVTGGITYTYDQLIICENEKTGFSPTSSYYISYLNETEIVNLIKVFNENNFSMLNDVKEPCGDCLRRTIKFISNGEVKEVSVEGDNVPKNIENVEKALQEIKSPFFNKISRGLMNTKEERYEGTIPADFCKQ